MGRVIKLWHILYNCQKLNSMFTEKVHHKNNLNKVADKLLRQFADQRVFAFYGKMGAGKTTFIQAICKALGTADNVTSLQLDNETINSWKAGVARALKKYIPDGTLAEGTKCGECGSEEVIYQEGCLTCISCGSSKCG